jgi:hypothetical protein
MHWGSLRKTVRKINFTEASEYTHRHTRETAQTSTTNQIKASETDNFSTKNIQAPKCKK